MNGVEFAPSDMVLYLCVCYEYMYVFFFPVATLSSAIINHLLVLLFFYDKNLKSKIAIEV